MLLDGGPTFDDEYPLVGVEGRRLDVELLQLCATSATFYSLSLTLLANKLERLSPANKLEHLSPANKLEHLSPTNKLEHLSLANKLEHLSLANKLEHLFPENKLEHLSPPSLSSLGEERDV